MGFYLLCKYKETSDLHKGIGNNLLMHLSTSIMQ